MEYELYYAPAHIVESPENDGLQGDGLDRAVRRVREAGATYRVIDVSDRSREELEDAYERLAVPPSVRKRYRVRHIFGTNKYSGTFFGKGVPALVVLEDGRPQDVYPHEEDGKIVTIKDFLDRIWGSRERAGRGRELAARMDALRVSIGPLGVPTSELVEEGRTR